jgi:hypothetical protein
VGVFFIAPQIQVAIFIVQDLCLLLAAGAFFFQIFSSSLCLTGFLRPLLNQSWSPAVAWLIYFGLTVGLHVWAITQWYQNDVFYLFSAAFRVLFTVQRVFSYIYYYLFYRKALGTSNHGQRISWRERFVKDENLRPVRREHLQEAAISQNNPPSNYVPFPENALPVSRLRV